LAGKLVFVDYGDDFILGVLRELSKYINIWTFKAFVLEFFEMVIRDPTEHDDFCVTFKKPIGYNFEDYDNKGPAFLQRDFIRKRDCDRLVKEILDGDATNVLPFKATMKTIRRTAFGSEGKYRTIADCVLSCVGQAWDTMGTNPLSYLFCQFTFDYLIERCPISLKGLLASTDFHQDMNLSKLVKKLGLSRQDLEQFPLREDIIARHKFNSEYINFQKHPVGSVTFIPTVL